MFISLFLVPDLIGQAEIGAILPLTRIINVAAVPVTVIAAVFLRFSTKFEAGGQLGKTNKLMRDFLLAGLLLGSIALIFFVFFSKELGRYYNVSDYRVVCVIGLAGFLAAVSPALQTSIQALERYRMFVWGNVTAPSIRLLFAFLLLGPLQILGLFIANTLGSLSRACLMAMDALPFILKRKNRESYREHIRPMWNFAIPFGIYTFLVTSLLFIEASVVRTALGESQSAGFFMITTIGSAPMFLLSALVPLLLPVLSHRHERQQGSKKTHLLLVGWAAALGLAFTALLFLIGPWLFSLRSSWEIFQEYGSLLWLLGLAYCGTAIDSIHRTNLHAKSSFRYLVYYVPVQAGGILLLLLSSIFLRDWLTLERAIYLMLTIRWFVLAGILYELFYDQD